MIYVKSIQEGQRIMDSVTTFNIKLKVKSEGKTTSLNSRHTVEVSDFNHSKTIFIKYYILTLHVLSLYDDL